MATPAGQAKAQELNAKLEGKARVAIDDIEKTHLRQVARSYHGCALKCYDKADKSQASEVLEQCVQTCELPHRQANMLVQQEIANFQNRLNRAMQECQDVAQDQIKPGMESDPKQLQKVESGLLSCMEKTVNEYISKLSPLKQRIGAQIKK